MIRAKDLLFRLILGVIILVFAFLFTRCTKEEPPKVETKNEQGSIIVIDSNYEDSIVFINDK